VSLIFGCITCAAGVSGVVIGTYAASILRKYTPKADPLICGVGLIGSAPFLYLAMMFSSHNTIATWVSFTVHSTLFIRVLCYLIVMLTVYKLNV